VGYNDISNFLVVSGIPIYCYGDKIAMMASRVKARNFDRNNCGEIEERFVDVPKIGKGSGNESERVEVKKDKKVDFDELFGKFIS
jgi:hypothetical protein